MIRCAKCKQFVKNVVYTVDGLDNIKSVKGWCKHCHKRVDVEYDCYEDIVGWTVRETS